MQNRSERIDRQERSERVGRDVGNSIAALFCRTDSVYRTIPGVDVFDIDRDALTFLSDRPVVAPPPCRAWGQLSHFAKPRAGERELSNWAIDQVRKCGGVLEHPRASRLWAESACGSFGVRDRFDGVLLPVYQSWWGHAAQKYTCIYVVGADIPELPYQAPVTIRPIERMSRRQREATPPLFAQFLVDLARSVSQRGMQ